jgi:predicted TIM-barrel fold metal-dependent hydrolase
MRNRQRIDVHHHVLPPQFVSALNSLNIDWTGGPDVPKWSHSYARDTMKQAGIDAAVASVSPGVYWGGDTDFAVSLARSSNEYLADLVRDDPEHFGGFATMPLPDVDASLRELEYACGTLGLDGVVLFTSQGDRYLGDPLYEPFFEELERREAIVFIRTRFRPGQRAKADIPLAWRNSPSTPRCVTNLLNGTLRGIRRSATSSPARRHCGLAWRIAGAAYLPELRDRAPTDPMGQLQRLFYDTALSTSEFVFAALKEFVPTSQILFGSDFPFVGPEIIQAETAGIENSKVLDDETRAAIDRGNALQLFPKFAGAPTILFKPKVKIQADIQYSHRVGEGADRQVVDARTRVCGCGIQRQPARRLEFRVGSASVAALHSDLRLPRREVVQQNEFHVLGQYLIELFDRVHLDLARQIRRGLADSPQRLYPGRGATGCP